jgi:toxin CcdB
MAQMVVERQFDVFANPNIQGRRWRPFVVAIQSQFLARFRTRVIVPLVPKNEIKPVSRLNPVVAIEGKEFYFHPVELAHIPTELLREHVANLDADRDRLVAAIDIVFTGI